MTATSKDKFLGYMSSAILTVNNHGNGIAYLCANKILMVNIPIGDMICGKIVKKKQNV